MRIIYIANARIPTEKAHGFQIMKMCEEFSDFGNDVELIIPRRINKIKQDSFSFYGIKKNFKIKKIFSLDLLPCEKFFGKFAFYLQNLSFAKYVAFKCLFKKSDIIFSRDLLSALILSFLGKNVCFEIHDLISMNFWTNNFFKNIVKFVSTNDYKKEKIIKDFNIKPEDILVASNGVDLEKFGIKGTKEECRDILNLPQDKEIIVYTGHLYDWKGVYVLLRASRNLQESLIVFVGGTKKDIRNFQLASSNFKNIKIIGRRLNNEIPYWLKSADALILPNSKKINEMQARATSPIKLFEYMASGVPIVASDIPSVREIVSEREVCFVEPDNPERLVRGIRKVLNNPEKAKKIAEHTREMAKQFTWQKRARRIVDFLK